MGRTFMPRLLIYPLIIVLVINLAAIYSQAPVHDPQVAAMVKLLKWRDPLSGQPLNLPIDRNAALDQQIRDLQNLQSLNLTYTQLSELPSEIGNLTNLQYLDLTGTQLSELPAEIEALPDLVIIR